MLYLFVTILSFVCLVSFPCYAIYKKITRRKVSKEILGTAFGFFIACFVFLGASQDKLAIEYVPNIKIVEYDDGPEDRGSYIIYPQNNPYPIIPYLMEISMWLIAIGLYLIWKLTSNSKKDTLDSPNTFIIGQLILVVMLFVAAVAPHLPVAYYNYLRFAVTIFSLGMAEGYYRIRYYALITILIPIAILFNPIYEIYLHKITWQIIDLIAALIFGGIAYYTWVKTRQKSKPIN